MATPRAAIIVAVLALGAGPAAGAPSCPERGSPALRLEHAARALADGRAEEALACARDVPAEDALALQARFVAGYGLYRLGRHEQAEQTLAGLPQDDPQFLYLRALVAVALARPEAARDLLRLVKAHGAKWRVAADDLLEKLQEREERARAYRARVEAARRALAAGDLAAAASELERAGALEPEAAELHYYRGFLAYGRGEHAAAARSFERAVEIAPSDGWSRYMLAHSASARGDEVQAREILATLAADGTDPELRQAARQAHQALAGAADGGQRAPPRLLALALEAGSGIDSNPGFLADSAASSATAWGVEAQARFGVERQLGHRHRLSARGLVAERAYAQGGNGAEQTLLALEAGYALTGGRMGLGVTPGYRFDLWGHQPLVSTLGLTLRPSLEARPWLTLGASLRLGWRVAHADAYAFLGARTLGAGPWLALRSQRLQIEVGYVLDREWAEPVTLTFADQPDQSYRTDYTFLGHGPWLGLRLTLPWRLGFMASGQLAWRRYDVADTEIAAGAMQPVPLRRDLRVTLSAELERALGRGVAVALRYEGLLNDSSLDGSIGSDRNYARHLVSLLIRWSLAR